MDTRWQCPGAFNLDRKEPSRSSEPPVFGLGAWVVTAVLVDASGIPRDLTIPSAVVRHVDSFVGVLAESSWSGRSLVRVAWVSKLHNM